VVFGYLFDPFLISLIFKEQKWGRKTGLFSTKFPKTEFGGEEPGSQQKKSFILKFQSIFI